MAASSRRIRFRAGETIAGWDLIRRLGGTANSEVWEAQQGPDVLAIKFLKEAGSNRYQRFKDEVRFLREMAPPEGVLPWRDSNLPERPSSTDPAWLAMPVATPIAVAIAEAENPAREAVAAVRAIALTLARLAELGIAHRDVKPGNLFALDGRSVVGDFGLVAYPDKPEVTRPNQKLGPAHFVADEMVSHPDTADPHPADVYSLAKTLWVLCVPDQDYPPSGQQRVEVGPATIRHWVAMPRVGQLDLLIDRSTAHDPEARPTMIEFADELSAWLAPPARRDAPDLSLAASRIGAVSETGLRLRELRERRRHHFDEAVARMESDLADLVEALAGVFPVASGHRNPPLMTDFGHRDPPERIEAQTTRGAMGTNADPEAVVLMLGAGAQWVADDEARFAAWIHVEDPYAGSQLLWSRAMPAPLASAQQDRVLDSLRDDLAARLPEAAEFVAGRMEIRTDRDRYACWTGEETGPRLAFPSIAFAPIADNDHGCYVVDTGNHRVRRFGPGGIELPWHAQGGQGDGETQLDHPMGGCFTHERQVWVADHDNQRIRYFDEHGGPLQGFGVRGPGTETLSGPADVATGPDGMVFVADRQRDCVVVFNSGGAPVDSWGGPGRDPGQLSSPCGIAVRHGAFVYVSDSGNDRIQKFDREGRLVHWWGGTGRADGHFHTPHGIALDSEENVYVADSRNHRIQQFTAEGEHIRSWGSAGEHPCQFLEPRGVAVDGIGDVYVVEHTGQRVQRFSPAYLAAL